MPKVPRKVWTNRRKWMGNLLPAIFFLPLVAWGVVWMYQHDSILGLGLWLVVGGTAIGWIALNLFGLLGNAFMGREIKRNLTARGIDFNTPHFFVGFARPRFFSILDAHEDLGYLFLRDDEIEFVGEDHRISLPRNQIHGIRFRPNVHTWVGLGRWISIEGKVKNLPVRMNVEPRERNYLFLNLLDSARVKAALESWRK